MSRVCALLTLLLTAPVLAAAADLRITDSSGAQVVVRDASIDYPAALGSATRVSDGIRVRQGDGQVTVKWKDIQSVTLTGSEVDVRLRNGKQVNVTVQRPGEAKLRGKTDLGEYAIDLDKVRSIEPLR